MIKLVDQYVGRSALYGLLGVWLVMAILYVLISLLRELQDIQGSYDTGDVFWFIFLTLPRMSYKIFPVSALLGVLVGVGDLASSNQLVAFRTAGVSRLRLALAALAGAMVITIPVMVMGEWVAPPAEQKARTFRLSEMVGQAIVGGPRGIWIRDGKDFVNIQRPLLSGNRREQTMEFQNVVIYTYSEGAILDTVTRADLATHNGERWTLDNVTRVQFSDTGASKSQAEHEYWATEIKPQLMDSAITRPSLLSLRSLWKYMEFLGENGLDDRVYTEAFWEKVLFPFTVIALILAGMPFVFGAQRSQNMGVRLFFGMVLGGVFLVVNDTIQQIGSFYLVPTFLSSLVPILLLAGVSIVMLRRSV